MWRQQNDKILNKTNSEEKEWKRKWILKEKEKRRDKKGEEKL